MGRSPCCDKLVLKKGPWTPEEDQKLLAFIEEHGHGNWRALPLKAGLQRCGKSCRLRWTNYLRPDIKRGKFTLQEEQTIIQLHALLGNRWSAIATHLPKRTDNEIKNYWNTHLKKKLTKMGIDPVTHKSKNDSILSATDGGHKSKNAANLSHMTQWESARLEAEARLVHQSKLRPSNSNNSCATAPIVDNNVNDYLTTMTSVDTNTDTVPRCLDDVVKTWHSGGVWPSTCSTSANNDEFIGISMGSTEIDGGPHGGRGGSGSGISGVGVGIDSPTSTLSFSENNAPPVVVPNMGTTTPVIEFMRHGHDGHEDDHQMEAMKESDHHHNHSQHEWSSFSFIPSLPGFHDINATEEWHDNANDDDDDDGRDDDNVNDDDDDGHAFKEGFTELLLNNTSTATKNAMSCETSQQEDNKIYWNSILNLVNSSPSHSPMF